jgi:hypothetical protein
MPQQQQQDVFDQALAEMQTAPAANAPTPAPSWQQNFEKIFPAAAQAAHQMAQVPQGLMQMAGSVSPLRFREGWDSPTLEVPEAVSAMVHPLHTLAGTIGGVKDMAATMGREFGALVAPNSVQAPTQPQMDQATQGATKMAAGLLGPKAISEGAPAVGSAIQGAATKAGIPQLMSEVADTPIARVMGGRPIMRAAARRLYDPPEPPPTPTIDAQFVESPKAPSPQGEYQDVASSKVTQKQLPAPTAPKPKLAEGPAPQKQLAPVEPGTQTFQGQDSGLGPKPHQDVVAQRPMVVRTAAGDGSGGVPGRMRLETVNEMKARLASFGRGVTKQPTAEAEKLKLPKPTPPKRAK